MIFDPLNSGVVVLDGLPDSFSYNTLATLTDVLPHNVAPAFSTVGVCDDRIMAWVFFNDKANSIRAASMWNGTRCDGHSVLAWEPSQHPKKSVPLPTGVSYPNPAGRLRIRKPASRGRPPAAQARLSSRNSSTADRSFPPTDPLSYCAPRYPFAPMTFYWFVDFLTSFKADVLTEVMDCLMNVAIVTVDKELNNAISAIYYRISPLIQGKSRERSIFDLRLQIFEQIATFLHLDGGADVVGVIENLTKQMSNTHPSDPQIRSTLAECTLQLREFCVQCRSAKTRDVARRTFFQLRKVYVRLTPQGPNGILSTLPEAPMPWSCGSDGCRCRERLAGKYPINLSDVDTLKFVDALTIGAMRERGEVLGHMVHMLLQRVPWERLLHCMPHLHNGIFAMLRRNLFVASRLVNDIQQDSNKAEPFGNAIEALLSNVMQTLEEPTYGLVGVMPLMKDALVCVGKIQIHEMVAIEPLLSNLRQLFLAISGPTYHLCIHSTPTVMIPREPASMSHCANVDCKAQMVDLLKCSGCKMTWYCSVDCQKTDWQSHRAFCREVQKLSMMVTERQVVKMTVPISEWL